jgi:hypothetical protein
MICALVFDACAWVSFKFSQRLHRWLLLLDNLVFDTGLCVKWQVLGCCQIILGLSFFFFYYFLSFYPFATYCPDNIRTVHYIPGRLHNVLEAIFFDASMEVKIYLLYIIFLSWSLLSLHLGSPTVLLSNIYPPLEFFSLSTWAALPSLQEVCHTFIP